MRIIKKIWKLLKRMPKLVKFGKAVKKFLKAVGKAAETGLAGYDFYKKIDDKRKKR